MDLRLRGKRALVTGSTSGIGRMTAIVLGGEGARVVVHGRDRQRAESCAAEIAAGGGEAHVVLGDLGRDDEAIRAGKEALSHLGGIDILVNCAGVPEFSGWSDTEPEAWLSIYNNNVVSMARMVRAVLPSMRASGWGRIINIASVVAHQPFASKPHYSAARAAVVNLTLSLSREVAESGITVNTISPGIVLTPPARKFFLEKARLAGWGEDWAQIEKHVLAERLYNNTGRLGQPEDVAYLIAFLASPLAGYVNGANYRVDGGTTNTVN